MANPTDIAPSNPEIASGHALASGLRLFLSPQGGGSATGLTALRGDGVKIAGRPSQGYAGYGTGDPPEYLAGAMTLTPTNDRAVRNTHSTKEVSFPSGGWVTGTRPNPFCVLGVFRHRMPQPDLTGAGNIAVETHLFSINGGNSVAGLGLSVPSGTSRNARLSFYRGTAHTPYTGFTLTVGSWYAVAMEATSSSTTRKFFIYDLTAQSLITPSGGGLVTDSTSTISMSASNGDATLCCHDQHAQGIIEPLIDWYAWALWSGSMTDGIFQGWYEDPHGVARGTYAPSASTLVAGNAHLWDATTTQVIIHASRPSGGASSGVYTYQWYRSVTANFTPGAGTLISGATSLTLTHTPPDPATVYSYKLVASDGTTSVTYGVVRARCYAHDTQRIGVIGDSITWGTNIRPPVAAAQVLSTRKRCKVQVVNRARFSSKTAHATANVDWTPGRSGGLYDAAKAEFLLAGLTKVSMRLGTNDADGLMTKAVYKANMAAIAADLTANGMSLLALIPPQRYTAAAAFSDASIDLLTVDYPAALAELDVAGTIDAVGTTEALDWSLTDRPAFPDETHPSSPFSSHRMADGDAAAWEEWLLPSEEGGGTVLGTVEG